MELILPLVVLFTRPAAVSSASQIPDSYWIWSLARLSVPVISGHVVPVLSFLHGSDNVRKASV